MSHFIANLIRYNKEEDKIYVRGGDNNLVPRSNEFSIYHQKNALLLDLISGCLKLKSRNKLAERCFEGLEEISKMHQRQFGEREEVFGKTNGQTNPFSLYSISTYGRKNKQETIKRKSDLSCIEEWAKKDVKEQAEVMESVWEEATEFYAKAEKVFFNYIQIPLN